MAQIRDGEGIKPSKKYSNGSVHENASGQFQVLDRYLDTDDNQIYLKIQWLKTGDIEVNKEVNVSASIWKFQKSRGIEETKPTVVGEGVSMQDLYDINVRILQSIDEQTEIMTSQNHEAWEHRQHFHERTTDIMNMMVAQHKVFKEMMTQIHTALGQIEDLHKRYDLATKLVEKI